MSKSISKTKFKSLVQAFDFRTLFNELGWDNDSGNSNVVVDKATYVLKYVSHKSGFKILHCETSELPDYATRRKIDTQATRLFRDHLIIFTDNKKAQQTWLLVLREPGKPARTSETRWNKGQSPELLYQRAAGLFFHLDEEGNITILDVKERVAAHFAANAEKVTKKFYEQFRKEHQAFMGFIKGIAGQGDREWYASLMLNRLMFCYFIQKKDFLDRNRNYLREKLKQTEEKRGRNKFYSFYRDFLLALFHNGLGEKKRLPEFEKEFGRIPYLNGGLFDVHELEKNNADIKIADDAFEKLFDFFDQYEWHLDNRPIASGKDINPDVIGFIFEKYINDRADMGAYYTKEDITEYISKNCILPFLFDETKRRSKKDVFADSTTFQGLANLSPDRYIFPAVRKGIELTLPDDIAEGLDTTKPNLLERRKNWNKAAEEDYALPTEIWRETIERRQRCERLRQAITNGEVKGINDFVTLNLDIRQFAQDVIENTDDPDWLRHFFHALKEVTVLDPTCGSGAFLFAALNILEPLYEACLLRIRSFVEEAPKGKYKNFEEVLAEIERPEHPNEQYYIHKTIILHNLYGVDIMREAVEIAKLRLFLRLAATVDADYGKPNLGLEPLPDVDFNIRSGNAVIGYTTFKDALYNIRKIDGIFADDKLNQLLGLAEKIGMAFSRFRDSQLINDVGSDDFRKAKNNLNQELYNLNAQLSHYLALSYLPIGYGDKLYNEWHKAHKPFHWCTEFYSIMEDKKGFDVIVGNPPYTQIPKEYFRLYLSKFETALDVWSRDENLYTIVLEQSLSIGNIKSKVGMIVPLSVTFSTKKPFTLLRKKLYQTNFSWYWLNFDRIPSGLFGNEVRTRCTILIKGINNSKKQNFTTPLIRWESDYRNSLFQMLKFSAVEFDYTSNFPKVGSQIQANTLKLLLSKKHTLAIDLKNPLPFSKLKSVAPNFPKNSVFIGGTAYNWFPAWRQIPATFDEKGNHSLPARTAGYLFKNELEANVVFALLCSSLGYWWWAIASDGFNLKKWLISSFPISLYQLSEANISELSNLGKQLNIALKNQYVYKDNKGKIGNFFLPACANEIEKIDNFLSTNVDGFSIDFFNDIKNFNSSFSRSSIEDEISDDDDD